MMNMKKLLALLLAIVMVVGMFPMNVFAEDEEPAHLESCTEGCAGCECACHQVNPASDAPAEPQSPADNCPNCDNADCIGCDGEAKLQNDGGEAKDEVCETCQKDPCECKGEVCETCQKDPCECKGEVCETCQKDPCECKGEVCETCQKDPCECKGEVCETCQKDPCECKSEVCETCQKDPCECKGEVCETCQKNPCECKNTEETKCALCESTEHATNQCSLFCGFCQKVPCECVACDKCGQKNDHTPGCVNEPCEKCEKNPCECIKTCEHCGVELTEGAEHKEDCLSLCTCDPKPEESGEHTNKECKFYIIPEITMESVTEDVTILVTGQIPDDVKLSTSYVPEHSFFSLTKNEIEFNSAVYDFIGEDATVSFAFDITLTNPDGTVWQPEEGETVTVTMDVTPFEIEDGTILDIIHDHEGSLSDLGEHTVSDGKLSFEMTGFSVVYAVTRAVNYPTDGKIYFDLAAGDVIITESTYTGKVFVNGKSGVTQIVTGAHKADNEYYVFQTNGEDTVLDSTTSLPVYDRVMNGGWGSYITNNTDVLGVISRWNSEAAAVGRAESPSEIKLNKNVVVYQGVKNPDVKVPMHHRIEITSDATSTTNFNVTIDNIWSGFQNDDCRDANGRFYDLEYIADGPHYRTSGGLSFRPQNKTTTAHIYMVGDNRFGNIHYEVGGGAGGKVDASGYCDVDSIDTKIEQMFFESKSHDGIPATLTVGNLDGDNGYNHFDSVIGGSNNPDYVPGLVFKSGVVYAGATELDNCTAIGGGGCGFGGITIYGGTITAVTATNGAAIGGGIGDGSNGGAADIEIKGGTVYAYNKGLAIEGTRESRGEAGTISGQVIYAAMPAVAIGSGSSRRQWTVPARIRITGGTVYAESVGGTAIGGGSSVNYQGADADITISSGANVTAKSVAGNVTVIHEYDSGIFPTYVGRKEYISASTSIGGGTAGVPFRTQGSTTTLLPQGNGGTATLTISGDSTRVYAGSIGGGGVNALKTDPFPNSVTRPATEGKIGAAHVTISGGTVQGQVIMAKGGTEECSFNMSDGTIDNSTKDSTFTFLKDDGGAVWIENGTATISAGTIQNCEATNGGAIYLAEGTFTMTGGTIKNSSANNGGAVYVSGGTCNLNGGTISGNHAEENGGAVYVYNTHVEFGGSNGITIENNTADGNGGGLYISQTSGQTTSIATGKIYGNKALSGNGGGIFHTGKGTCTISGLSEIKNNEASNGGGLYIDDDSHLKVEGGAVCYNNATGTPTGIKTAYNDNVNKGVGGGIYVASGSIDGSKFEMQKSDENVIVGIYMNKADFAANDVYANKETTILKLPDIAGMTLAPGIQATGWYEDYATNDTKYNEGYDLNPNAGVNGSGVERYEDSADTYQVNAVDNQEVKDMYLCLTIGVTRFGKAKLTIQKTGVTVDEDDVFYFVVSGSRFDDPAEMPFKMVISIQGTGIAVIEQVPYGDYTVTELNHWRYADVDAKSVTLSSTAAEKGVVFENVKTNNKWLDDTADPKVNITGKGD